MKIHNNSVGKGKGITTIFKQNYSVQKDIKEESYQITKITSQSQDIVNIYRSSVGSYDVSLIENLISLINPNKDTIVLGDFNMCFITEKDRIVLTTLHSMGFKQLVTMPSHIQAD